MEDTNTNIWVLSSDRAELADRLRETLGVRIIVLDDNNRFTAVDDTWPQMRDTVHGAAWGAINDGRLAEFLELHKTLTEVKTKEEQCDEPT